MEWVGGLTPLNLLAVYDVALDLRDAGQLTDGGVIPILPTVVRFAPLMPVDGISMRDRYAEHRWNAVKFLEKKGVVRKVEPLIDPYAHRWQGRLRCELDRAALGAAIAALQAEYERRTSRTSSVPAEAPSTHPLDVLRDLLLRFHAVATALRQRHAGRATLDVTDEYDVQDLLGALLTLEFNDVRREEWTPSYAGGAGRVDFLLKTEQTVVEVKKTRSGLNDRQLGDELLLDIARYAKHGDCKTLVCFVYDPDTRIINPGGLQADLSGEKGGIRVEVVIAPKRY